MSTNTRSTSPTSLPNRYAAILRGAYVVLILVVWTTILAGTPDAVTKASSISPEM